MQRGCGSSWWSGGCPANSAPVSRSGSVVRVMPLLQILFAAVYSRTYFGEERHLPDSLGSCCQSQWMTLGLRRPMV